MKKQRKCKCHNLKSLECAPPESSKIKVANKALAFVCIAMRFMLTPLFLISVLLLEFYLLLDRIAYNGGIK